MARNLNSQLVGVVSLVVIAVFVAFDVGGAFFYSYLFEWLDPNEGSEARWMAIDIAVIAVFLALSLGVVALVTWRQSRRIVRPLKAVATAARNIAGGNFSARAEASGNTFGEGERLVADFNMMAARLEQAENELRYSNSAIAHELRTPLTILRGRLQGLADGVFPPSQELYERLIAHIDDLARIVEDLRILGLSSAGQMELKLERFDLASEAAEVAAAVADDLAKAGIALRQDLGRAIVIADRSRLRQVLFALFDNARRYAPDSRVTIETRSTKDRVLIRCSDTGPGLPAGLEDHAFERFWRADDSRARIGGGSGLGLAVVRAVARAHGGDAAASATNAEKGASFEVWLPAPPLERL